MIKAFLSKIYEIMLKKMVEPDGPQMTIRSMRFACWITTATNIVRICNTHCFCTATMVMPVLFIQCNKKKKMLVLYSVKVITRKNGSADSTVNLVK